MIPKEKKIAPMLQRMVTSSSRNSSCCLEAKPTPLTQPHHNIANMTTTRTIKLPFPLACATLLAFAPKKSAEGP